MTALYDFNGHLHMGTPRPAGTLPATIKTPHVMTVRPHKRAKAHRPTYAAVANVDGTLILGARYLCGAAAASVRPISTVPDGIEPCGKCERTALGGPEVFSVYAYYDRGGQVLYVGQTVDLAGRHKSHSRDERSARWFGQVEHRAVLSSHATREQSLAAEVEAIERLRPKFNVRHTMRLRVP